MKDEKGQTWSRHVQIHVCSKRKSGHARYSLSYVAARLEEIKSKQKLKGNNRKV